MFASNFNGFCLWIGTAEREERNLIDRKFMLCV